MQYAIVNGERLEAEPGLKGSCPGCEQAMIAKCGTLKVKHWAHQGKRNCDPWWENETEWHRAWKKNFPITWHEVSHFDEVTGERHFADVKTAQDWVLEFQHSPIKPDEKNSRNIFYKKIIWVVDGTRRLRDKPKFLKMWEEGRRRGTNPTMREIAFPEDSALMSDWSMSGVPVFFDFGDSELWWFLPPIKNEMGYFRNYVAPFAKDEFIEIHRDGRVEDFLAYLNDYSGLFTKPAVQPQMVQPQPQLERQTLPARYMRRRWRL
jgi:competence protein CoiA